MKLPERYTTPQVPSGNATKLHFVLKETTIEAPNSSSAANYIA
jgi:hypothetical protein